MLHDVMVPLRCVPADRYMSHRAVAAAMGCGDRGVARNYLFAIVRQGESGLIVVRTREPERLRAFFGADLRAEPVCTPEAGKRYAFWLRASPRVSGQFGKKHAIPPERLDRLAGWMATRGDTIGVAFDGPMSVDAGRVKLEGKGCKTTEATISGTLRAIDAGKLARAMENGIGPHKTMGFGLLQLHPLEI